MKYPYLLLAFVFLACSPQKNNTTELATNSMKDEIESALSYLALGDSYTIGESVPEEYRWPNQLKKRLDMEGIKMDSVHFIATTGWTTDELMQGIASADIEGQRFDLVSLSIGVNNQYRGRDTANYRKELKVLIERALDFADGNKERLFLMNIPDWGVTPFAKKMGRDAALVSQEIEQFNKIMKEEAALYGLYYEDIFELSKRASSQEDLIANDGLHPSAKMYQLWVDQFAVNHLDTLVGSLSN